MSNPDLLKQALEALKKISKMYTRTWDKTDGGLAMFSESVDAFEDAHEKVRAVIEAIEAAQAQPAPHIKERVDTLLGTAQPVGVPAGIGPLVNALLHQIDIGDFVDSNGHSAKMLKPVHDLMRLLAFPSLPVVADDALEIAAQRFEGVLPFNWCAADGYSNGFSIASELRLMAEENAKAALAAQGEKP